MDERGEEELEKRASHIDLSGKMHSLEISIAQGFSEMKSQHALINKDMVTISAQQNKVVECLYGNGHEGLITKVAKINQRLAIIWAVLWGLGIVGVSILGYFVKGLADKIQ